MHKSDSLIRGSFGYNAADDLSGLDVVEATDKLAYDEAMLVHDRSATEEEILHRRARHIQQDVAGVWFKASRIEERLSRISAGIGILIVLGLAILWRVW